MKYFFLSILLLAPSYTFATDELSDTEKEIIRMAMEHDAIPNRPLASESLQRRIDNEINGEQTGICLYEVRNPVTETKNGRSSTKVTAYKCYEMARAFLKSNKNKFDRVFVKFGDSQHWTVVELKDVK